MKRFALIVAFVTALVGVPAAQAQAAGVPWSQVQSGWVLTISNATVVNSYVEPYTAPADTPKRKTRLTLVSPSGRQWVIKSWAQRPDADLTSPWGTLVDWSGDHTRALFLSVDTPRVLTELVLRTGALRQVPAPDAVAARYTQPSGKAFVVSVAAGSRSERWDLQGRRQAVLADGPVLSTQDGTGYATVVGSTVRLVSGTGAVERTVPAPRAGCLLVRFWSNRTVLVQCANVLHLVPLDGRGSSRVSIAHPTSYGDYDDFDAWSTAGHTWFWYAGACGSAYLATRSSSGTLSPELIPGAPDSVTVAALARGRFILLPRGGCTGPRTLLSFDPVHGTSRVLLSLPAHARGISQALVLGHTDG